MGKFFLVISLSIFSCLTFAQNKSLEGTSWVGVDGTKQLKYEMTFMSGNIFQFSYYDEQGKKVLINGTGIAQGTWRQSGNNVYMEVNNKFTERNGVINGDTMSGSAANKKGANWNWRYQIVKVETKKSVEDKSIQSASPPVFNNLAEEVAYCSGVFQFAAVAAERNEGKALAKDWEDHAFYKATKIGKLSLEQFNKHLKRGGTDAHENYNSYMSRCKPHDSFCIQGQAFNRGEALKRAVTKCEATVRSLK
jgi:hypothetical protein